MSALDREPSLRLSADGIFAADDIHRAVVLNPEADEDLRADLTRFIGETVRRFGDYQAMDETEKETVFGPFRRADGTIDPSNFATYAPSVLLRALADLENPAPLVAAKRNIVLPGIHQFYEEWQVPNVIVHGPTPDVE